MNKHIKQDDDMDALIEKDSSERAEEDALDEVDFYPPEDTRAYVSNIESIGREDFYDFSEYFWELYEDDLFDCNN